jgi:hypothetical protein
MLNPAPVSRPAGPVPEIYCKVSPTTTPAPANSRATAVTTPPATVIVNSGENPTNGLAGVSGTPP